MNQNQDLKYIQNKLKCSPSDFHWSLSSVSCNTDVIAMFFKEKITDEDF